MKKIKFLIIPLFFGILITTACQKEQSANLNQVENETARNDNYSLTNSKFSICNYTECPYNIDIYTCIDSLCCLYPDSLCVYDTTINISAFDPSTGGTYTADSSLIYGDSVIFCRIDVTDQITGDMCTVSSLGCQYSPVCSSNNGCMGPFNVQLSGFNLSITP